MREGLWRMGGSEGGAEGVCVCAGRVGVGMLPISISPELSGHLGSSMIDQTGGFNQGVGGVLGLRG